MVCQVDSLEIVADLVCACSSELCSMYFGDSTSTVFGDNVLGDCLLNLETNLGCSFATTTDFETTSDCSG